MWCLKEILTGGDQRIRAVVFQFALMRHRNRYASSEKDSKNIVQAIIISFEREK